MPKHEKPIPIVSISANDAAQLGITRLRLPKWANPMDHVEITIIDGEPGPWAKLHSPANMMCNNRDPVELSTLGLGPLPLDVRGQGFVPYEGPLPDSEEYKAEAARFASYADLEPKAPPVVPPPDHPYSDAELKALRFPPKGYA